MNDKINYREYDLWYSQDYTSDYGEIKKLCYFYKNNCLRPILKYIKDFDEQDNNGNSVGHLIASNLNISSLRDIINLLYVKHFYNLEDFIIENLQKYKDKNLFYKDYYLNININGNLLNLEDENSKIIDKTFLNNLKK